MFYWSPNTKGFYLSEIHKENIPEDKVEITQDYYNLLLAGQEQGKIIASDSVGYPILVDPPELNNEEKIKLARQQRLIAYREEADPLFFKIQRNEATNEEWIAKIQEIKTRYPYPI